MPIGRTAINYVYQKCFGNNAVKVLSSYRDAFPFNDFYAVVPFVPFVSVFASAGG